MRTPWGGRRFEKQGDKIIQHSMVDKDMAWEVVQVADTIDISNRHYNAKSALAKTVRFDSKDQNRMIWGGNADDLKGTCAMRTTT